MDVIEGRSKRVGITLSELVSEGQIEKGHVKNETVEGQGRTLIGYKYLVVTKKSFPFILRVNRGS